MADSFETSQTVTILKNDTELTQALLSAGYPIGDTYPLTENEYVDLSTVLIENKTYIIANTVTDLVDENHLRSEIAASINIGVVGRPATFEDALFKQIYYSYKYSAIKTFFRINYRLYLPEMDYYYIKGEEKKRLFAEAFMREFDRFTKVIDEAYNAVDVNSIPIEYLNYLAQIIGYDRQDYRLISNISFRELLSNMIEIYKIKGTNYSFELFFNFLGFDITLNELWFDKRYGDEGVEVNPHNYLYNKSNFRFFLSTVKPTDYIPDSMDNPYAVTDDIMVATRDLNLFNYYTTNFDNNTGDTGYSWKQLIGDTGGYPGDTYTFFKTNFTEYNLQSLGTGLDAELDDDDLEVIAIYMKFLNPVFISKNVIVAVRPYIADASDYLNLKDDNRTDPLWRIRRFPVQSVDVNTGDSTGWSQIVVYDPRHLIPDYSHVGDQFELSGLTDSTNNGIYRIDADIDGNPYVQISGNNTIIYGDTALNGVDQTTPQGYLTIGGPDRMFHSYQGPYPSMYYWGDTALGDSANMDYGDTDRQVPLGGHFISGDHIDTRSLIYDASDPASLYSQLLTGDTTDEVIMAQISDLVKRGDTGIFDYSTYGIRDRDLISPLIDTIRNHAAGGDSWKGGDSWLKYYDEFGDSYWGLFGGFINQVYKPSVNLDTTSPLILGMNIPMETRYDRPFENYDISYNNKAAILKIDVINGDGLGEIQVLDYTIGDSIWDTEWSRLTRDDYIELIGLSGDTVTKVFRTKSSSHITNGDTTIIIFGDSLPGTDQGVGGYAIHSSVTKVKQALVDNGGGVSEITLFDTSRKYYNLLDGDTIYFYSGDSNAGAYVLDGNATHTRSVLGDSFGYTTFVLTTVLDHDGDSYGYIKLNTSYWDLNSTRHPFGYNYIAVTKA